MNIRSPLRLLPLAAVVAAGPVFAEQAPRAQWEALRPELQVKAFAAERWTQAAATSINADARIELLRLPEERIEAVKRANAAPGIKRLRIGVERDLGSEVATGSASALVWRPVAGGWQASVEVEAPGAAALRVAVDVAGLPDGAWLRSEGDFAGQQDGADVERMRDQRDAQGRFWTSTTTGERQRIEWFVPASTDGLPPSGASIAGVSHLIVDPHRAGFELKALGDSGSCNIDVVCRTNSLGNLFVAAKNAVARMVFQDGGSYTCTGTLLNDLDNSTQRKWFYSAHHCIDSQAVASTLETYWQYETPTCNVDNSGQNIRVTGGADYRHSSSSTDALLLELRGNLPANAAFAGWDAGPLSANDPVTAIHHPSGDIKKVTFGRYLRTQENTSVGGQLVTSAWRTTWAEGTTEGGSSGSGLFTRDNASYYLRGGLIGGAATCGNSGGSEGSGNYDYYSRLDRVYPSIQQFIGNTGGGGGNNGATRDYTGQWYNANQARRGLSLFRLDGGGLFSLWFRYDSQNRAQWYQLEDIWTGQDRLGGRVARFTQNSGTPTFTGTYTLVFNSATTATFTYTNVDGDSGTVTLTKGTP
jgi:lysyl endopeptidase